MVVSVPVAGAPDPAVLRRVRVLVAECVREAVLGVEDAVEVVLERREERVPRPVVRLQDVQVAEKDRRGGSAGRQSRAEAGQPLPLTLGLFRAGIAGGDIGAYDLDGATRRGQGDGGGAGLAGS